MKRKSIIKKFLLYFVIIMMFSLVACGNDSSGEGNSDGIGKGSEESQQDTMVIKMRDYVTLSVTGYDGAGELKYSFDYEKFMQDYKDRLSNLNIKVCPSSDSDNYKDYEFYAYGSSQDERLFCVETDTMESAIQIMLENVIELGAIQSDKKWSNGESVDLPYSEYYISLLETILGVKLEWSEMGFIVSGLKEMREIDPFASTGLFFFNDKNGQGEIALEGYTYIDGEGEFINLRIKEPENQGKLSNGDKLFAYLSAEDIEYYARTYGICFTRYEAEIEVHGLNAYGQLGASNGEKAVVNINDYIYVTTSGHEKVVWVQLEFNIMKFLCDYYTSISENVAEEDLRGENSTRNAITELLSDYIPYNYEVVSHEWREGSHGSGYNIENGDKVTIVWGEAWEDVLEHLQRLMNVEFVREDFEFVAEGIKETKSVDVFEYADFYFYGTNGEGLNRVGMVITMTDSNGKEWSEGIVLEPERDTNVYIGDVIKVKISESDVINLIYYYGCEPIRTEFEVVVSDLE